MAEELCCRHLICNVCGPLQSAGGRQGKDFKSLVKSSDLPQRTDTDSTGLTRVVLQTRMQTDLAQSGKSTGVRHLHRPTISG